MVNTISRPPPRNLLKRKSVSMPSKRKAFEVMGSIGVNKQEIAGTEVRLN